MAAPHRDEHTGTATTGHEWDGIHELDTPLPRWWLWTFYITIIWGIGYTIAYPAWPLISSATPGVLGYSSRGAVAAAIAKHEADRAEINAKVAAASFADITADKDLANYAQAGGEAVFKTYCAQCHGAGAAGAVGYPNLKDDDWLWGGTADEIATTITHGIRSAGDEETRDSAMPAFGTDEILTADQIGKVADYVLSLSGQGSGSDEGKTIFADNCATCHGEDGKGGREFGAPNLADAIWLYGGSKQTIVTTITGSRKGVMPAWAARLSESQIKQVAYYVHALGGGE